MAEVYHFSETGRGFLAKLESELKTEFAGCKRIAVKLHFGEPGNKTAFKPEDIEPVAGILKKLGIDFFLYDTSVSYDSPRNSTAGYKKAALEKGWGNIGEVAIDGGFVDVKMKHLTHKVGKPLADADGVLVVSHFKGHVCCGFGGAIKNLGMGGLSKKSKQDIHDGGRVEYIGGCTQCKTCERVCPLNGIKVTDKPEFNLCYGCSNCAYSCPAGAIKPKIAHFDILLAEGAGAAQSKFKKKHYVTFLKNMTKECDCERNPKMIIAPDNGLLISKDIVAIDKAAYDIITSKGKDDVFLKHNKKSGLEHVNAAEKLGMGNSSYTLVEG
ncbi:MAG: DUF362 domain-containing protein [Nanoarchaeota archaeon]|nr:DUF362 domain-containing protein [Nanoarchaeota archaeon]